MCSRPLVSDLCGLSPQGAARSLIHGHRCLSPAASRSEALRRGEFGGRAAPKGARRPHRSERVGREHKKPHAIVSAHVDASTRPC